jgi:hypothetical protein
MTGRSEVIGLVGDYQLPISFLSISFSPETYEEPKKKPPISWGPLLLRVVKLLFGCITRDLHALPAFPLPLCLSHE